MGIDRRWLIYRIFVTLGGVANGEVGVGYKGVGCLSDLYLLLSSVSHKVNFTFSSSHILKSKKKQVK